MNMPLQQLTLVILATITIVGKSDSTWFTTPDDAVIPVELWDQYGEPISLSTSGRHNSSKLPPTARYLVARVGVSNANTATTSLSLTKGVSAQHVTLDLGNSHEAILLVEGCRGCVVYEPTHKKTDCGIGARDSHRRTIGCPSTVPKCKKHRNKDDDQLCFASRPKEFLPSSSYKPLCHPNGSLVDDDGRFNEVCPCPNGTKYAGDMRWPPSTANKSAEVSVCMQCFDCEDHSRFFVPAVVHEVIFVRPSMPCNHNLRANSIMTLKNLRIGALVRTVPQYDRIWSNVGVGFNSSLLQQAKISSLLLDLHDGHNQPSSDVTTVLSGANKARNGVVIFNPNPKRYHSWNATGFQLHRGKRIHFISSITLAHQQLIGNSSASYLEDNQTSALVFHIDSGNDGISIDDETLRRNLANVTGGRWKREEDSHSGNKGGRDTNCSVSMRLYVPRKQLWSNYTQWDLVVNLSPTAAVHVPSRRWIFQEEVHLKREDDHHNHQLPTIFTSYHKNVFGLPFILSTGGMVYDDENHTIYVAGMSDEQRMARPKPTSWEVKIQ